MTKQRKGILYDESFKNKKCAKIKITLGINWEKCLDFISNTGIIIFLVSLEKQYSLNLPRVKQNCTLFQVNKLFYISV